ncbi:hypothetical protein P8631_18910, partial [Guyparkeria sp. 1SP6A2]|nr:hypothetical protein [Guyparkeria sp. 1SP6A2]
MTTAAKIIDCVLSLRKPYNAVVVPRVQGFMEAHPDVRTCDALRSTVVINAVGVACVLTSMR